MPTTECVISFQMMHQGFCLNSIWNRLRRWDAWLLVWLSLPSRIRSTQAWIPGSHALSQIVAMLFPIVCFWHKRLSSRIVVQFDLFTMGYISVTNKGESLEYDLVVFHLAICLFVTSEIRTGLNFLKNLENLLLSMQIRKTVERNVWIAPRLRSAWHTRLQCLRSTSLWMRVENVHWRLGLETDGGFKEKCIWRGRIITDGWMKPLNQCIDHGGCAL